MKITFDPVKREKTLLERGLDFARAEEVFAEINVTVDDDRQDYREARHITVGRLDGRVVVVVWTERGASRQVISMRKANEREVAKYTQSLG